jgi:hypothetical protein
MPSHSGGTARRMGERGYRKTEPEGIPRETSQVFAKVFSALRDDGVTKAEVARQLFIHPLDIDALVFGLAITTLPGGASSHSGGRRGRGNLKLV